MSDQAHRFAVPHLLTARATRGSAGRTLLVYQGEQHARGVVADLMTGERPAELDFPVSPESMLTGDGEWLLQLDDENGSELGHLCAIPVSGGESVDLTPDRPPYVVRGLDVSADGGAVLLTAVDEDGFHLIVIPFPWERPKCVYSSPHEAWWGRISADGTLASIDSTDHGPGVRRTAVTVIDVAKAEPIAVLDDLPDGPVRASCFAERRGDPRLLVTTERTGYARPALWNPVTGERRDFTLPGLDGEVVPLDWCAATGRILAVHVDDGIHIVGEIDIESGERTVLAARDGSYMQPDVAGTFPFTVRSWYLPDGSVVLARSRWDLPLHLTRVADGTHTVLFEPAEVPHGQRFSSHLITSRDRTKLQLWAAFPEHAEPRGTVLSVHGGPNLVTVDGYSPDAQSWLDAGFAYAALNYRGSVTFGQRIREGFLGALGERELEDVEAAIAWLRGRGAARPESTFITGASYGGFLTLMSLGRLPHLFAGGLAEVAMADWKAAHDDQNAAQNYVWQQWLGGEPDEFEDRIRRYSPITYVERVTGSVWLNQGVYDTRTPSGQAQKYADALAATGADVVLDWFEAGHEYEYSVLASARAHRRKLELAERTLRGRRWADSR
ncbi:alpha/beta hydrolase family protein [Sciscionella marina]|uniref:alpha/beta hydrolase family protein n=1 Tax=Sciscionella marina TaxID=508770 RepID=UPI00038152C1|nr:prolyl oligopeptidase family serine peptidase [Sciscionella marina]